MDEARSEANESQQSAKNLFNEQKRIESQHDRMKDEVNRYCDVLAAKSMILFICV